VKLGDCGEVSLSPLCRQPIEQPGLVDVAPQRIVRFGPLDLLYGKANILQQLVNIGDGGAPCGREPLTLLAMDLKSALERRPELEVVHVQHAGSETAPHSLVAAVDNDCIACPNDVLAKEQLYRLEHATRGQHDVGRRACREAR